MKGIKISVLLLGMLLVVFTGFAFAAADTDCNQGAACKMTEETPDDFEKKQYDPDHPAFKSYLKGNRQIDGVALRRDSENPKVIDIMFATKLSCSAEPRVWDVAVCGALEVGHRVWENNKWADKEIEITKGQYQNCDNFQLKTNCGYDALHVKVQNNQVKVHVAMDGKDEGGAYELFVGDQVLQPRKNWYHFLVK